MKKNFILSILLIAVATPSFAARLNACNIFTSNAVLQRDKPMPIWGSATPGDTVSVIISNTVNAATQAQTTTVDKAGKWMVTFPAHKASTEEHIMLLKAFRTKENDTQLIDQNTYTNLVYGDIWLCSGQSNMDMSYGWGLVEGKEIIEQYVDPMLRMATMHRHGSYKPDSRVFANWDTAKFDKTKNFSATGFFFAYTLRQAMPEIPIGLVGASWGGTWAESWLPLESLLYVEQTKEAAQSRIDAIRDWENGGKETYEARVNEWERKHDPLGTQTPSPKDEEFNSSDWETILLPTKFETTFENWNGGLIWLITEIELTQEEANQEAILSLGAIDDKDVTYINGKKVGENNYWSSKRSYKIKAGTLKAGKNLIAIRAEDTNNSGGFISPAELMYLEVAGSKKSLAKEWKYKLTKNDNLSPKPEMVDSSNKDIFGSLYNGMIYPLTPMALKGAIWYQGCANERKSESYYGILTQLIKAWRESFNKGSAVDEKAFPFYIVQLPNYRGESKRPCESGWASIRNAQALAGRSIENCGTIVTLDIGNPHDIHPKNKLDVGKRLGWLALAETYGKHFDKEYASPEPDNATIQGTNVVLKLKHAKGLSTTDGETPKSFQLAGEDKVFVWADAAIGDSETIILTPQEGNTIPAPRFIRYAWDGSPSVNLVNEANLPLGTFELEIK